MLPSPEKYPKHPRNIMKGGNGIGLLPRLWLLGFWQFLVPFGSASLTCCSAERSVIIGHGMQGQRMGERVTSRACATCKKLAQYAKIDDFLVAFSVWGHGEYVWVQQSESSPKEPIHIWNLSTVLNEIRFNEMGLFCIAEIFPYPSNPSFFPWFFASICLWNRLPMPFFYEVNALGFKVSQRHLSVSSHPNPPASPCHWDVSGTVPTGLLDARSRNGGILVDTLGILAFRVVPRFREREHPCRARQRVVVFFWLLWSLSTSIKLQGIESLWKFCRFLKWKVTRSAALNLQKSDIAWFNQVSYLFNRYKSDRRAQWRI